MAETNINELDLHLTDEDPDLGIAQEGVRCKDMHDIVRRITEVKDTVKKINLNNQHTLTEIPSIFKECKLLEELNISHTDIGVIPDFLFELPNLRALSCCCRELSSPPTGFAKAEKLEKLHIRINEGWNFPDGITAMQELKTLAFDLYSAIPLPDDLGALKKLEDLTLYIKYEKGDAPTLPQSFTNHGALKRINIGDHIYRNCKAFDLNKTAQILASCKALESFKLSGLMVGNGHKNLSMLYGLKELELRHLSVEGNIFESINTIKNLEKLYIWGSDLRIANLPDMFNIFKELTVFSFAGNFILNLPPSIYGLTKLNTLEIGSTGISALGEEIGNLQNLEKIHVYDNMLEKLPQAIFTLPRLNVLNIEENYFRPDEIAAIGEKLKALGKNGQKIEFMSDGQGHRQKVKKLRSLTDAANVDAAAYVRICLEAVNENPFALKYANKQKLHESRNYSGLCKAAVNKNCMALETIDPKLLDHGSYFNICMEAAKSPNIEQIIESIEDKLLTDEEYIQICLEAALHNRYIDFLEHIKKERLKREDYERICWASILHFPATFSKMSEPTEELRRLAVKLRAARKR
jgi:Leucine-rich repeat (LRR) protein